MTIKRQVLEYLEVMEGKPIGVSSMAKALELPLASAQSALTALRSDLDCIYKVKKGVYIFSTTPPKIPKDPLDILIQHLQTGDKTIEQLMQLMSLDRAEVRYLIRRLNYYRIEGRPYTIKSQLLYSLQDARPSSPRKDEGPTTPIIKDY